MTLEQRITALAQAIGADIKTLSQSTGGSSTWGNITGTLSSQTDLQSALDGKQAADADLTALAALTPSSNAFIVGDGSTWSTASGAAALNALGAGTVGKNLFALGIGSPVVPTFFRSNSDGTVTQLPAATFRIAIGAQATGSYQPLDADLTTIAALTPSANAFIVGDGSTWATASGTTARTALGLGDAAVLNVGTTAGTVAAGDHDHTGVYHPLNGTLHIDFPTYQPSNYPIQVKNAGVTAWLFDNAGNYAGIGTPHFNGSEGIRLLAPGASIEVEASVSGQLYGRAKVGNRLHVIVEDSNQEDSFSLISDILGVTSTIFNIDGAGLITTTGIGVNAYNPQFTIQAIDQTYGAASITIMPPDGGALPDGLISLGAPVIVGGILDAALGIQISGAATSGQYLRGNGTGFVSSAIQAADIPILDAANIAFAPLVDGNAENVQGALEELIAWKLDKSGGTMTGAITFAAGQTWPTFNQNTTGSAGSVAWSGVTSKPTTLAGYGITDAASSSHTHSYLPLAGGTMTGAITFAAAQTWPTFNQNTTGSAGSVAWSGVTSKPTTLAGYGITDAQASLGFTPVQQAGGTSQTTNKIYIGWSGANRLYLQVDASNFTDNWPINATNGIPSGTVMLFVQTAAPTGWTKNTTHNDKTLRVVSGTASSGGTSAFSTVFASRTPAGSVSSSFSSGSAASTTATGTIAVSGGAVSATTLNSTMIPSHSHSITATRYTTSTTHSHSGMGGTLAEGPSGGAAANASSDTATGGGLSHTHAFTNPTASFTGTAHTHTVSGSVSSSFSGTAMDFSVQYVDVIIATKN